MTQIFDFNNRKKIIECNDSIESMSDSSRIGLIYNIGEIDNKCCSDQSLYKFMKLKEILTAFVVADESDTGCGISKLVIDNNSGSIMLYVKSSFVLSSELDRLSFSSLFNFSDEITFSHDSSVLGSTKISFKVNNLYK